jgi:hypothetical protein
VLALEQHALRWSEALDVSVEVYGDDTGKGPLPPSYNRDPRYRRQAGFLRSIRSPCADALQALT